MMRIRLPYGGLFTRISLCLAILFVVAGSAKAQAYVVNGSTYSTGGNCYTLTPDYNGQNGSLWYQKRIDLRYNFDIQYSVYLGTNPNGADGMAFVLQSVGNTIQGTSGSGMGYGYISPSIEVEYDTYVNSDFQASDPLYDHMCIMKNGDFHHNVGQLVSPVPLTNIYGGSVKDGQYHTSRIVWDVASKTMTVYFDGNVKFVYTNDILNSIFFGQPAVYFGFTASTGGLSNQHAVCINASASTFTEFSNLAAPQIVVPSDVVVNNDAGQCSAVVNFAATETTGVPASAISYSIAPGSAFPVGTTPVTATATNSVGSSSKSFNVTVIDNEKPKFVVIAPGTASVAIPYLQTTVSSWDVTTFNFTDPLPPGAIITGIDLSYSAKDQGWGGTNGFARFYVAGNFIGGNTIPDHSVHSLSLNYTGRIPGYVYGGNNSFQFGFEGYPGWQGFFYGGTMTIHYQSSLGPISVNNETGKCGAAVILINPLITDNCGVAGVTNNAPAFFPVGTTNVTWTATDIHNNNNTTIQTVKVTDIDPPLVKTKPAIVLLVNGSASLLPSAVDNGSTDNCSIASMTLSKTNFDCSNKGPNSVVFTVTDVNGNSASANVEITVMDASSPVPSIAALPVLTGQCAVSATAPTATDGCGATITATTTRPVTFSTQGYFTINWTYTAANGKTTSQLQQVIVHNTIPPSIPTLPDITGQCSAAATAPTTTDNCGGTVTGMTTDPLTYNQQGNYVIHWSFTDGNGNSSTATQNVIVKDITPPVINSVANISVFATSAAGAIVNYTTPIGTDNCSVASTALTAGLASGATFPIGITTVTYTVTDVAGLTTSTSFKVTVLGQAPQIVVPSAISVNNDAGQCGAVVNFAATETAGIPASILTYSVAPGTVFPVGTTIVTATATNAVGKSSKTFTVTVTDNEKPNFFLSGTASVSIPYLQTPISSSAAVTYNFADPLPAGALITGIDLSYSAKDQGWGYTGGYTRFYVSGTFIGGNVIADHLIYSLNLNYKGGIPGYVYGGNNTFQFGFEGYPGWQGFFYGGTMTIHYQKTTIPAPISVKNDPGKCGAALVLTSPLTSDNCDVANVTNDAPALFPVGTTTVTWTVTDIHNNSNSTSQKVTVTDNEPPVITAPANLIITTDPGNRVATNVNLGSPITNDNCAVEASSVQNDAPAIFPLGTTTVTWTVKDIHGNTNTATQTVTVTDKEPPVIATLAAITKNNDPGVCGAIVTYTLPGVTDNVSTNRMIVSAGGEDGTVVFNTPLTNNVNSLSFISSGDYNDIVHGHGLNITVTIELYNPLNNTWTTVQSIQTGTGDYHFGGTAVYFPVISQVSQIRFTAGQYVGYAVHLYQMGINLNSIPFVQTAGLPSGSLFPVGTTVNTFQAIDVAGNISTQSFTVTINDAEKPKLTGYQGSVQFAMANCSWTGSGGMFTVTDNCSAPLVVSEKDYDSLGNMIYTAQYPVTQGGNALANRTFPLGVNTVQLIVTDAAGNVSDRAVFTVKVVDNTNPSIVTSGNITRSADPGICGAYIRVPQPVTQDNCSVQSVTNSFNNNVSATGNYPVGITVVTWTVTDGSGNKTTAVQTITVTDNEPPVIVGVPSPVIQTNDMGTCGAVVTWTPVWATDNCRVLSFTSDHQSGDIFPLGVTTVTFIAKDIHNNTSTASFTITVTDNEAPKIITKPVTIMLVNGAASILAADINNGTTDNCGGVTLSASKTSFTCADAGINRVTLTATDSYGNTSSAIALVTVTGEVPLSSILITPSSTVFTGGNPANLYLGYGPQSVTLTANITGTAPIVSYAWSGSGLSCINCQSPVFTASAPGSYTFSVVATNKYGCTTTSSVSICVRDIRVTPVANSKVYVCHTDLTTGVMQTLQLATNQVANQLTQNPQDQLGSCGMPACAATALNAENLAVTTVLTKTSTAETTVTVSDTKLTVKVSPNPSNTVFTFIVGSESKMPVNVRLIDISGKAVEYRNDAPVGAAFRMGANLISGIYFAEFIQSKERIVIKLIKENR